MLIINDPNKPKHRSFLAHMDSKVDVLEGTTYGGKTTIGAIKFILKVAQSKHTSHLIAGYDIGTVEKNIINSDLGILDFFGDELVYFRKGSGQNSMPHLKYREGEEDEKTIFIAGYGDASRWKKSLGSQYGCIMIDEVNVSNIDFTRQVWMRFDDYMQTTSNPDDPDLEVYHEYLNHARPLPEFKDGTPIEILNELNTEEPYDGWVHWYFSYEDNAGLTAERRDLLLQSIAPGTRQYDSMILGIRGKSDGLVFDSFDRSINVIPSVASYNFVDYSLGVDTAYSSKSEDTISVIFLGLTDTGKIIAIDEYVKNNKDLADDKKLTPSTLSYILSDMAGSLSQKFGIEKRLTVYIDSADQATISEARKMKRQTGDITRYEPADKSLKVIDRIRLMAGWISSGDYLVHERCQNHIKELETYSYRSDGKPEDRRDHTINAAQYGWMPFSNKAGVNTNNKQSRKYLYRQTLDLFRGA